MTNKRLQIVQDEESPVAIDVLAASVVRIADGIKRLGNTPLNRDAIDVLVSAHTKVAKRTVTRVLDGLRDLEATYLKKKSK